MERLLRKTGSNTWALWDSSKRSSGRQWRGKLQELLETSPGLFVYEGFKGVDRMSLKEMAADIIDWEEKFGGLMDDIKKLP